MKGWWSPSFRFSEIWGGVPFLLFIHHCYIHFKNQDLVLFLKTIFHLFLNSLFTLFFVMRVSHISYHIHTDKEVVSISHLIAPFPGLGLRKLPSSIVWEPQKTYLNLTRRERIILFFVSFCSPRIANLSIHFTLDDRQSCHYQCFIRTLPGRACLLLPIP